MSASEAAGCSHTAARSWPNVSNRWRCSSLSVLRRLASVARWRFHLRDMDEGVMPAPCSFPRHQTVVRIDPIILPSGPLDLVTRLLQGSCSRLPLRVMGHLDLLERQERRLDPRGLEGLQHRRCHGLIHTQAADRQA